MLLFLLVWIYLFLSLPIPFVSHFWEADILRSNMERSASRQVDGLSQEEIVLMLGEPEQDAPRWLAGTRTVAPWLYCVNVRNGRGRYFVIFFDDNGFAGHIEIGHIESSSFKLNLMDLGI